jgi:hypothetical protein
LMWKGLRQYRHRPADEVEARCVELI